MGSVGVASLLLVLRKLYRKLNLLEERGLSTHKPVVVGCDVRRRDPASALDESKAREQKNDARKLNVPPHVPFSVLKGRAGKSEVLCNADVCEQKSALKCRRKRREITKLVGVACTVAVRGGAGDG